MIKSLQTCLHILRERGGYREDKKLRERLREKERDKVRKREKDKVREVNAYLNTYIA